jgi:hypothetical protein
MHWRGDEVAADLCDGLTVLSVHGMWAASAVQGATFALESFNQIEG